MEYFVIIIASIFVNNVVLSQFLGICPFLGVSSRVSTSVGMGAAVTFVMAISSVVAYLIQYYVLVPLHIEYMQTIIFILVIAALVQMVEIVLKKLSPALYQALGIFLPQRGHLPFTGKQTGLIAQNFRTGRCQLSVHLLQLGTHRLGRLCRSLCRGRLGTALPRTIVLLPALRHGVPPIHPIRLIRL